MEGKIVLNNQKEIQEYLYEEHRFKCTGQRFKQMKLEYGLPVISTLGQNVTRTDLIDQWMNSLFEERKLGNMWSKYDEEINPPVPRRGGRIKRTGPKRKRKRRWQKDLSPKVVDSLMAEIDSFTDWQNKMSRISVISAGKRLLVNSMPPKFVARVLDQVLWAMYHECVTAYIKEGVPYKELRKQKSGTSTWHLGGWQKRDERKLNGQDKNEDGEDEE